jgi:hypothetical protein
MIRGSGRSIRRCPGRRCRRHRCRNRIDITPRRPASSMALADSALICRGRCREPAGVLVITMAASLCCGIHDSFPSENDRQNRRHAHSLSRSTLGSSGQSHVHGPGWYDRRTPSRPGGNGETGGTTLRKELAMHYRTQADRLAGLGGGLGAMPFGGMVPRGWHAIRLDWTDDRELIALVHTLKRQSTCWILQRPMAMAMAKPCRRGPAGAAPWIIATKVRCNQDRRDTRMRQRSAAHYRGL